MPNLKRNPLSNPGIVTVRRDCLRYCHFVILPRRDKLHACWSHIIINNQNVFNPKQDGLSLNTLNKPLQTRVLNYQKVKTKSTHQ